MRRHVAPVFSEVDSEEDNYYRLNSSLMRIFSGDFAVDPSSKGTELNWDRQMIERASWLFLT